jgi:hypothetical protein
MRADAEGPNPINVGLSRGCLGAPPIPRRPERRGFPQSVRVAPVSQYGSNRLSLSRIPISILLCVSRFNKGSDIRGGH